jgi:hypothetical protein
MTDGRQGLPPGCERQGEAQTESRIGAQGRARETPGTTCIAKPMRDRGRVRG